MRVTTWAEYGIIIGLHLARNGNHSPVPARVLAENEGLPSDYVEQILLKLRRAGLVESSRGAKGGYRLARHPSAISLKEIMQGAENRTFVVNCDERPVKAKRCDPGATCSIRPVWRLLQKRIDDVLEGITLSDLLREECEVEEALGVGTQA